MLPNSGRDLIGTLFVGFHKATQRKRAMRVQFEYTLDDSIDACQRMLARSKPVAYWKRRALLMALAVILLVTFVVSFALSSSWKIAAVVAVVAATYYGLMYPRSYARALKKRIHRTCEEHFAERSSRLCEVEVRPEGVWVRETDRQSVYEWSGIEEISAGAGSIDVFGHGVSGVIIRDRAFASAEQKESFLGQLTTAWQSHRSPQIANSSLPKADS